MIKTVSIRTRIPITVPYITSLLSSAGSVGAGVEKSKIEETCNALNPRIKNNAYDGWRTVTKTYTFVQENKEKKC